MFRTLLAVVILSAGLAPVARAQEATIRPAVIPALPAGEAEHLLRMLVQAQVAASNCPGPYDTAAPFLLMSAAMEAVMDQIGLDDQGLEQIYAPVRAAVDKPAFCTTETARIGYVLDMLVFWGGALTLIRG
ncbi:hypothetical protein [Pararhodobacter zhoushanensis]|uniref:Uncharacterized protein n=1 Tax=Pararhodobacter zhoushanensis TaxID=2479545 RepID=A0ABT3GUV3_9RHOB|nr:hypothetical protein [Pararhodobacter zhoushanensis]MCW1931322.1 hypothetical protein [Pararhodobacter zhoushanensis]